MLVLPEKKVYAANITADGYEYIMTGGNCIYAPNYKCDFYTKYCGNADEYVGIVMEEVYKELAIVAVTAITKAEFTAIVGKLASRLVITEQVAETILKGLSYFEKGIDGYVFLRGVIPCYVQNIMK